MTAGLCGTPSRVWGTPGGLHPGCGNILAVNNMEATERSLKTESQDLLPWRLGNTLLPLGQLWGPGQLSVLLPLLAAGTPPPFLTHLLPGNASFLVPS